MASGGRSMQLLDVDCGPENATRDLGGHFKYVVGANPSPQMIAVASDVNEETANGTKIQCMVSPDSETDEVEGFVEGMVDVVVASMIAL